MAKSKSQEYLRRYMVLAIGLVIMAFGVALSIRARLGTTPISSLPYVVSLFTPLTVGNLSIIMHAAFILVQILILRKQYQIVQLLQLPVAIAFGYLVDFALWAVGGITPTTYWQQCLVCLIGILLCAFGISLEVTANVVTLAGEGMILAICRVAPISFGSMKVIFDVTLVSSSVVLSLIFLHGLEGVREGTFAAAILVGFFAKHFNRMFVPLNEKFLSRNGG